MGLGLGLQERRLRALSGRNNYSWLCGDEFENILEHVRQRKAGWARAIFHVAAEEKKQDVALTKEREHLVKPEVTTEEQQGRNNAKL